MQLDIRHLVLTLLLAAAALLQPATQAQTRDCLRNTAGETVCPPAKTVCTQERDNNSIKCSPSDGGIILDRYGKAACGVGSCVLNRYGDPFCSTAAGGAAGLSLHGEPACTGGCEPARAARCTALSP